MNIDKLVMRIAGSFILLSLFLSWIHSPYWLAFTTFVGGTRQPENAEMDESELEELVWNELDDLVGLNDRPVICRIRKWPRAIPQYRVGYKDIQRKFDELESEFPGLYFSGNFRQGISVGDSVLCAHETVKKIVNN